ncbi:MAG: glycosyltransferase family 4 protein [Bacteroidota bacterium]
MKLLVGIERCSSLTDRFVGLPFSQATMVRVYDPFAIINSIRRRLASEDPVLATDLTNCLHIDSGFTGMDLFHLFNTLTISRKPWVVTYEHYLPRWSTRSRFGVRLMAKQSCKRIIAISEFAHNYQLHLLDHYPRYRERILPKLTVLHPAQKLLIDSYDAKPLDDSIVRCVFVGRDFFRKGGKEILRTFVRLHEEGLPLHLTVVSSLEHGDYASRSTREDRNAALRLLRSDHEALSYHEELENEEVLQLMRRSHVSLLPSYDDTYGFSVLESQAAGTPVVTTDVCALPEVNNESVGWVIPVPRDRHGIAHRHTEKERESLSRVIEERLTTILRDICANPNVIREKARRSLERIRMEHDPGDRARHMEAIYSEAVGKELNGSNVGGITRQESVD